MRPERVLAILQFVLFLAVAAGFATRGPRPWVRRTLLALIAVFVLNAGLQGGAAAFVRAFLLATMPALVLMTWAIARYRTPLTIRYQPLSDGVWPAHALASIDRWTRELAALGWVAEPDVFSVWQQGGDPRVTNTRFFRKQDEPCFCFLSAGERPKSLGRMVVTAVGDGYLATSDRQSDPSLFDVPAVVTQKVPARANCGQLVEQHRARLAALGQEPAGSGGDPASAYAALRNAWAARLVSSGQARTDGEWVVIRPGVIPVVVGRIVAGWLS